MLGREEKLAWAFGAAAGFLFALILVWSWPPPNPEPENNGDQKYESSPYGTSTQHEVAETPWEWWARMKQKTVEDPIAAYTLALTVLTAVIGGGTLGLWFITWAAEANKRSIVRGAGMRLPGSAVFEIQVSNAGTSAALIETVEYGFEATGTFPKPFPYSPRLISNEMVHPEQRGQPVKYAPIPAGMIDPMIVVRVVYFDVKRRRRASVRWAMQINDPKVPGVSIFINDPHPEDTFPLES